MGANCPGSLPCLAQRGDEEGRAAASGSGCRAGGGETAGSGGRRMNSAEASSLPPHPSVCLDAHVAASLQAEDWNHEVQREQVDAAVAASLQAETWREDNPASALQVEAWQVCSQRVAQAGGALPLPLEDASARPPTARLPLEAEVDSAASQLHWRLSDYGLRAREIAGDGACQFRAVADQLFGDQELHGSVRERALAQLRSYKTKYEGFAVGESFEEYLNRMAEPATWGDNLSLQAIADVFDVEACLVTSFLERSFICISPCSGKPAQQIWLGFYAEYHYTSLEPQG